jgi:outer membrane protein OmpA-like peptidoglycan-associated protein
MKLMWSLSAVVILLSGCASSFFPDFDDGSDIVVDDGGKVEVRKVKSDGVLVGDKANAAYEDDDEEDVLTADNTPLSGEVIKEDNVTPAPVKVIEVKSDAVAPLHDNVKVVEASSQSPKVPAPEMTAPTMHYLAETIYFDNGSATVSSSYQSTLRKIARIAKENKATVTVYGFASSRTRDTDPASHKLANFKVSLQRAENTAKALRRAGVPAQRILTQALSDSAPMYQEVMPEGERLNRRAEIYLTY